MEGPQDLVYLTLQRARSRCSSGQCHFESESKSVRSGSGLSVSLVFLGRKRNTNNRPLESRMPLVSRATPTNMKYTGDGQAHLDIFAIIP